MLRKGAETVRIDNVVVLDKFADKYPEKISIV